MPVIDKITISDFRNIEFQQLHFSPKLNCIWGSNGEGKTNLLDAIYYLCMTKSAVCPSESFIFREGTTSFSIASEVIGKDSLVSKYSLCVEKGGEKKLRNETRAYKKMSDHIGEIPVVMVTPSDISLISDSSEERRRFINSVLSQTSAEYLHKVQQYNRLLTQRNSILKCNYIDRSVLEAGDIIMSDLAKDIFTFREEFARNLEPLAGKFHEQISTGNEKISIRYRSDLMEGRPLLELMKERFEKDCILKHTTAGVHRDDFDFLMNGQPLRRCGSQGQQKSFLVSLKFAQYEIMRKGYGFAPLLLLDDVFDKLDTERTSRLLSITCGNDFGQIFLTDCNMERIREVAGNVGSECRFFECKKGEFTPIQ